MPFVLCEFHLGRKKYKSVQILRTLPFLTLEYRACQLLQQRFTAFTGKILIPTQTLSGGVFVFASFVVIKHRNDMEVVVTVMMVCFALIGAGMWGLCLRMGGYVFSNGTKLLNSWKYCGAKMWRSKEERRAMLKFHKSCRPLVISFGKMYTIRKLTVLGYFKGLVRCLMRVLLTLQTNK